MNSKEKVIIGCPKHGEFLMKPNDLLSGHGCPKCGGTHRHTNDEFIEKSKQIHPEYDYSKVNYVNSMEKVIIGCPKHGEFLMKPAHLLSSHGCPKCGRELVAKKNLSSTEDFITQAKQIRPEYDYSKVNYVNAREKVIIGCPKHGEFLMIPNSLLSGYGCPRCSESKGERAIRTWLENQKINFSDQHRFYDLKSYPYDFYLPEYNLVIEYNGIQHYEVKDFFHRKNGDFEGQLMRDHIKKDYAEKNGYDLLVIPYWEFKNIDKVLSEKLA